MDNGVVILDHCDESEFLHSVRINGLLKYNMEKTNGKLKTPDMEILRVARNKDGTIIGGACGSTFLSSLEVEVLWVDEVYRGQNIASSLLKEIENEAEKEGCHIAHLMTYSFQAPEFYLKQGYIICGEVDGFPDGIKLYLLKKQLIK